MSQFHVVDNMVVVGAEYITDYWTLTTDNWEFFTIFHHSNENISSSANFEARPLILYTNEQALIFCFSTWGH